MAKSIQVFIVTVQQGEEVEYKIVDDNTFTVGRSLDATIAFSDPDISRIHLIVTLKHDRIWIEDQGSANGTFVNDQKIPAQKTVSVEPGDRIKVGKSEIYLSFNLLEKCFKKEEIVKSQLPKDERDGLLRLVQGAHAEAQKLVKLAQDSHDKLIRIAENKASNIENATLLKQDEILQNASMQSNQIIQDAKRKGVGVINEAHEEAQLKVQEIYQKANGYKKEADDYYKNKIEEAQGDAERILKENEGQSSKMVEEAREKVTAMREFAQREIELFKNKSLHEIEELKKTILSDAEQEKELLLQRTDREAQKKVAALIQENQESNKIEKDNMIHAANVEIARIKKESASEIDRLKEEISRNKTELKLQMSELKELDEEKKHLLLKYEKEEIDKRKLFEDELKSKENNAVKALSEKLSEIEIKLSRRQEQAEKDISARYMDLELEEEGKAKEWSEREVQLRNLESQKRVELQKWLEAEQSKKEIEWKEREERLMASETNKEKDIEIWKKEKQNDFLTMNKSLVDESALLETRIAELKSVFSKLDTEHVALKTENDKMKSETAQALIQATDLKKEVSLLNQNREHLMSDTKNYEKRVGEMKFEIDNHAQRIETLKKDFESQKAQIKSQLENEKQQMTKDTYEQINQLKLLELEKLKQTKEDLLSELHKTKQRLSKEIHQSVEKALVGSIPVEKLNAVSNLMLEKIISTMEEQTAHIALSEDDESSQLSKDTNTVRKRQRRERVQQMMMGFVIGAIAIGILQATYFKVSNNANPVNDIIAEQAEEAKKNQAAKKFSPLREPELKDTYVDLVLYTDQFHEMYLSSTFNDKFGKAAMSYLLRTWRIEEEKSIQVVAMSKTLVKTLVEKKESLSTDFLDKGLAKLNETESETESKIVEILGSQVKYESYRKFEKKYFRDELEKFYLARNKSGASDEGQIDQSSEEEK